MIYSLTGKVSMQDENTIIVDTGVMAFEVTCSSFTAYTLSGRQEPQTVLTYLQVREDGMSLFGFANKKEPDLNKGRARFILIILPYSRGLVAVFVRSYLRYSEERR
jgi:hypothetical protein